MVRHVLPHSYSLGVQIQGSTLSLSQLFSRGLPVICALPAISYDSDLPSILHSIKEGVQKFLLVTHKKKKKKKKNNSWMSAAREPLHLLLSYATLLICIAGGHRWPPSSNGSNIDCSWLCIMLSSNINITCKLWVSPLAWTYPNLGNNWPCKAEINKLLMKLYKWVNLKFCSYICNSRSWRLQCSQNFWNQDPLFNLQQIYLMFFVKL